MNNKYLNMSKTKSAFKRFGFNQKEDGDDFKTKFKKAVEEAQGRWIEIDGHGGVEVVE